MVGSPEIVYSPRFDWYKLLQVTKGVIEARGYCDDSIPPQSMVFIGGMAAFFHLRSTFGRKETMKWRGTEDIDVVVFGLNNGTKLINAFSRVTSFSSCVGEPSHFPDKRSCRVEVTGYDGFLPKEQRYVDIDLYEQRDKRGITLNERLMTMDKIIADPPEEVHFGLLDTPVYVPSVRDLLQLKLDILCYSQLRDKDWLDITSTLAVAEAQGLKLNDLVSGLYHYIYRRDLKLKTNKALRRLKKVIKSGIFPPGWNIPSSDYIRALEDYLPA